jgi:hypothetical protein
MSAEPAARGTLPAMTHNGYCPGRIEAAHIDHVVAEAMRVAP